MASHEETPVSKSDKNVDLDNNSVLNSSNTINLSSDEEISSLNKTVDLSDDEVKGVNKTRENGDVEHNETSASIQAGSSHTEVFSFVGAEYSRDEDSPFPGEPPIKRPHSPEKVDPDHIKRKCEEAELRATQKALSSFTDSAVDDSTVGDTKSTLTEEKAATMWVPPMPAGDWPVTVTRLTSPSGGEVFLVGTAHFSRESQEDVAKVINSVRPHIVTVELCKARVNLLQLDEKTILEEAKNISFAKVKDTVQQNGLFNGLMYILLLTMSAHLTRELGMAPGGEFRRAFQEARKIPNCTVHLGDRPIHVTLQRALASLTWWQTTKLTWHILTSKDPISKEEVEKCKQKDLLEEMLAEMTGEFPALSHVFVHERDLYLAHSLALAAQPVPTPFGLQPAKVVGVVGIGHVPGIIASWGKVGEEDIAPILRVPPPTMTSKVIKFTVKASALGLVLWGAYKILPVPRVSQMSRLFK